MDVDLWPSRGFPSKHHPHHHRLSARYISDNYLLIEDSDGDDDAGAYFPCPFCYIDIEIHVLCSHLQDEHCFDLTNAVCPLCAANLGKDVVGHFIVQHASSLKHRRNSPKSALCTANSAMTDKEPRSFFGSSANSRLKINDAAPDALLSPFLRGMSDSQPEGSERDEFCTRTAHSASSEMYVLGGNDKLDSEEKRQRTAFVQQLITSTIL